MGGAVFMGVVVSVLVHLPEFWVFVAALCVSCVALAVFLWRMETEVLKTSAPERKGESPPDAAAAVLAEMGYGYDARQDALVSRHDAWQRAYGYSRLYDEAAARCGIIVHCEPVAFELGGRRYLLALWKGQYGLAAGAEIGLYVAGEGSAAGAGEAFYESVPDEESPKMAMTLFHRNAALFAFEERRSWLAAHRPGLYARPEDLVLRGAVSFQSVEMARAACDALLCAGYTPWEIGRVDETVYFTFARPHTSQPASQKSLFARAARARLCLAVRWYRRAARDPEGMDEILARLRMKSPALFAMFKNSCRSRRLLAAGGARGGMSGKEGGDKACRA